MSKISATAWAEIVKRIEDERSDKSQDKTKA